MDRERLFVRVSLNIDALFVRNASQLVGAEVVHFDDLLVGHFQTILFEGYGWVALDKYRNQSVK